MLRLAGTMDLRVNMLNISSFNSRTCRRLQIFLVLKFISMVPLTALADMSLSQPVGIHTIGKPIEVISTISGIPQGTESQLRSTCLRGRLVSMESALDVNKASDVVVNFQPGIAQGGTIEFRSITPVNHALVSLQLISECPLLVFDMAWPLIMSQREQAPEIGSNSDLKSRETGLFDPKNSSLLAVSRKAPKRAPQIRSLALDIQPEKPATSVLEKVEEVETKPDEVVQAEPVDEDVLKLASLDQSLINHGLIESEPVFLGMGDDSGAVGSPREEPVAGMGSVEILAISTTSLLVLGAGWLRNRFKRNKGLAFRIRARDKEPEYKGNTVTEFSDYSASENIPTGQSLADTKPSRFGSDRVLESLMGGDDAMYGTELEFAEAEALYADSASGHNNALKTCVEMINRADVRSWDLPPSYQLLVSERNKSLEMHRTPEALILRCHIGLVELAFQEAGHGNTVQLETSNELLQLLLGKHVYDLESNTVMGVPDVLKSYVKAKLCEIDGSEKRQLLRENLLSLNTQVEHQALCFHTNAWREFLSEEGLLG